MQFTVETVSCLGACGLAPVVVINGDEVHGQTTKEAIVKAVKKIVSQEQQEENKNSSEMGCCQNA